MELRRWDPLRSTSIPIQNVKVRLTKNMPEKFSRNLRIWWFLTWIFTIPSLLEQNKFACYTHLFQNKSQATWKTFTNCRNPWLWGIILLHITPIKTPFFSSWTFRWKTFHRFTKRAFRLAKSSKMFTFPEQYTRRLGDMSTKMLTIHPREKLLGIVETFIKSLDAYNIWYLYVW